jgi:hypothetical protein
MERPVDLAYKALAHLLTVMFVIGAAGCVIVIPLAAVKMFSVLFEKDRPEEE